MSIAYAGGLNFSWPVRGDVGWDGTVDQALTRISGHDHSGGGSGTQLTSAAFANDAIPGTKIRLANNEWLRGRNAANSADINLVRVNTSNQPEFLRSNTNDTPAVGTVGEVIGPISRLRSASAALTTTVSLNVCTTPSITLTPGDWWVTGFVGFLPNVTTSVTQIQAAVSKTTAPTAPATDTRLVPTAGELTVVNSFAAMVPGTNNDLSIVIPPYRVSVATNTTLYLQANATFTISSLNTFGSLFARAAR